MIILVINSYMSLAGCSNKKQYIYILHRHSATIWWFLHFYTARLDTSLIYAHTAPYLPVDDV